MFLNNNVLTVAGSLSNNVVSLTVNGQSATVYHDLTWAVPGGVPLTNAVTPLTAVVTTGGLTMTNSLLTLLPATVTLSYDADGNLTWDGLLAYTYDGAGEMTKMTDFQGRATTFSYSTTSSSSGPPASRSRRTWSATER